MADYATLIRPTGCLLSDGVEGAVKTRPIVVIAPNKTAKANDAFTQVG